MFWAATAKTLLAAFLDPEMGGTLANIYFDEDMDGFRISRPQDLCPR